MLARDPVTLRQYYMQTQEQRDIQKQERKLRMQNDRAVQNAVAEALEQMNTCVQRHKRQAEQGVERYAELRPYRDRGHRTIAEKRQLFHVKMIRRIASTSWPSNGTPSTRTCRSCSRSRCCACAA